MRLKKVKLENFKKFDDIERDFAPGINIVKGRFNEVGKSTFLDGIVVSLFENPKSASKELDKYQRWGIDRRGKTAIEFETDLGDYILEKDFEAKSLRLVRFYDDEEWTAPAQVSAKIHELLGTDSRALFLSTSCIRQDEVRKIESGEKEISQSLESIVTGGVEETAASQVVDKLNKHIEGLKKGLKGLAKTPGLIAELTKRVDDLGQELVGIREEVDDVEKQKLKFVETSHQFAQVEVDLKQKEAVLEKNKRRREVEDAIKKLDEEYEGIDKLIGEVYSLREQIRLAESRLQDIKGFSDREKVLTTRRQLDELEFKRKGINEDIPKREIELEFAKEQAGKNKLIVGLSSKVTLVIGAVVAAAGFLGTFIEVAIASVGVVGLILLILALWARSSTANRQSQISDLKKRIEQMKTAFGDIDEQEKAILTEVQCSAAEEFEQRRSEYDRLLLDKDGFQNQLKGKLGGQKLSELEGQKKEILKRIGVAQEKLTDDLRSTALSPEEYVRHENEVKKLKEEKSELERVKLESEVKIENARFDAEDLAQKEEVLEAVKNQLGRAQRKVQIYELARDFITKARTETLVSANDLLQAEIQKNFEVFSNGKYKKVTVSEGTLDFQIFSDEKGDLVQPEELSGGAIDEFYLACRLALVKLIYGESAPPLILDDPFVNFDKIRLTRTLEFLRQLSQKQQIIIFTLGDNYDSIADKCIELS